MSDDFEHHFDDTLIIKMKILLLAEREVQSACIRFVWLD